MTYIKRIDVTTDVEHRFASDLWGQGVDMCADCGRHREDRTHVRTAATYATAIAACAVA
jgi:hypothetical protein